MPKKRVFIAINFSEEIKNALAQCQDELSELPYRWTKPEYLHITLLFIGYVDEADVKSIIAQLPAIGKRHEAFEIIFDRLEYGPSKYQPRMVWATGVTIEPLKDLHRDIAHTLRQFQNRPETREYALHVTLGRATDMDKVKKLPPVQQDIEVRVPVSSIELMESKLYRTGAQYETVESFQLCQKK